MLVVKGRSALQVVDLPSCEVSNLHELNAQVQDQNISTRIFLSLQLFFENEIFYVLFQLHFSPTTISENYAIGETLASIFSRASSDLRYIPLTQSPWPDFPESAVGCLFIILVDDFI